MAPTAAQIDLTFHALADPARRAIGGAPQQTLHRSVAYGAFTVERTDPGVTVRAVLA